MQAFVKDSNEAHSMKTLGCSLPPFLTQRQEIISGALGGRASKVRYTNIPAYQHLTMATQLCTIRLPPTARALTFQFTKPHIPSLRLT